jgi:arsenite methyltransferase
MAKLPFTSHGFTIRPVGEIAAALKNWGLRVEHYLFVGQRTAGVT